MARKKRYKIKEVIAALEENNGLLTYAARDLGFTLQTVINYANRHEVIRDKIEALRSKVSDIAENNILSAIGNGDCELSKWWLSHMRKERFGNYQKSEIKSTNTTIVTEVPVSEEAKIIGTKYLEQLQRDNAEDVKS